MSTAARWCSVWDADPDLKRLCARHYTYRELPAGATRHKCIGPGEYSALLTADGLACFVWRKFIDDCELAGGINCAVFRNEGPTRSSDLIREADALAWGKWPEDRHYTYVDPGAVRSTNAGCCFKKAGWRACGWTKGGLLVLEVFRAGVGLGIGTRTHAGRAGHCIASQKGGG